MPADQFHRASVCVLQPPSVGAARLYVGWSTASETVTSVLLGVLWTAVFMVAWATRDRAVRAAAPRGPAAPADHPAAPAGEPAAPADHPAAGPSR